MDLKAVLKHRLPPEEVFPPGSDLDPHYRPWGFTIYRTAYGGGGGGDNNNNDDNIDPAESDRRWTTLLHRIQTDLEDEFSAARPGGRTEDDEEELAHATTTTTTRRKLLSLFRLDARSDRAALAGRTPDQLRAIYNSSGGVGVAGGGEPRNARGETRQSRLFLLADEEVLTAAAAVVSPSSFPSSQEGSSSSSSSMMIVKCVEVDHRNVGPPSPRVPPTYFGWMRMTTRSLWKLWACLDRGDSLETLAPPVPRSGNVRTWTGEEEEEEEDY